MCECSIAVWCGEGVVVPALNRRRRLVWGGDISGEAAGELGLLLEVRPDSATTGDATARAAAVNSCRRVRPVVV
jgi:hypothetical protein